MSNKRLGLMDSRGTELMEGLHSIWMLELGLRKPIVSTWEEVVKARASIEVEWTLDC